MTDDKKQRKVEGEETEKKEQREEEGYSEEEEAEVQKRLEDLGYIE